MKEKGQGCKYVYFPRISQSLAKEKSVYPTSFFFNGKHFFFFFTNYPQLYQILHFLFLTLHLCASCMEYWVLKWEILWVGWVQLWLSIKKKKYENSKLNNSSFYSSYPLPVNSLKPLYWCLPTIAKENALFKCSEFWYNSICKKISYFPIP